MTHFYVPIARSHYSRDPSRIESELLKRLRQSRTKKPSAYGESAPNPGSGARLHAIARSILNRDDQPRRSGVPWEHCPSPLNWHTQIIMHFSSARRKGDISNLCARGYFYFALTFAAFCLHSPTMPVYTSLLSTLQGVGDRTHDAKESRIFEQQR